MYYPYLRAKQMELLALRDFVEPKRGGDCVMPIIEPLKSPAGDQPSNNLRLAISAMLGSSFRFALVLNPNEDDFRKRENAILQVLRMRREEWIPAFLYDSDHSSILNVIEEEKYHDAILIFKDGISDIDRVRPLLQDDRIATVVLGGMRQRSVVQAIKEIGKGIIGLDECFRQKPRNADYLENVDEPFSEAFYYYKEEGYIGFSDYTVLPKLLSESGMLPYAVAIHITYQKGEDSVNVHHFVSDTNDDYTNTAGKFMEAAKKLVEFFDKLPKTPAVEEFIKLYNSNRYPGLGIIKKLSILNHIQLMHRLLGEKL